MVLYSIYAHSVYMQQDLTSRVIGKHTLQGLHIYILLLLLLLLQELVRKRANHAIRYVKHRYIYRYTYRRYVTHYY
jgi:hypothetical protein